MLLLTLKTNPKPKTLTIIPTLLRYSPEGSAVFQRAVFQNTTRNPKLNPK